MYDRILALLKKTFRTDIEYIIRSFFWLLSGQGIATVTGIAFSIVIANFFEPELFGFYQYAISSAALLSAFTLTGLRITVIHSAAKNFDGDFLGGVKDFFLWNLGYATVSLFISLYYWINENSILFIAFLAIALLTPLSNAFGLYAQFLTGKKDFKLLSILQVVKSITLTPLLIYVVLFDFSVNVLIVTFFAGTLLVEGLSFFFVKHRYKLNSYRDPKTKSYSKNLSVMSILGKVSEHIDKVIVFHLLGAGQLAIYGFSLLIVSQLRGVFKMLSRLAVPKMAERDLEEIKTALPRKLIILTLGMCAVYFSYILFAEIIYQTIFPKYLESVYYSQIYALLLVLLPANLILDVLTTHEKQKSLYVIHTLVPIVRTVALIFLILEFGIIGSIWAILFSFLIRYLLALYFLYSSKS